MGCYVNQVGGESVVLMGPFEVLERKARGARVDRQSSTRRRTASSLADGSDPGRMNLPAAPSRRKIFESAVGVAAVGATAGTVLAKTSPAAAATTIEQGALAPAVVNLTDAATVAVDASLGNDFRVTIAADRTMGNPANPTDGQQIIFQVTQGPAGSAALNWDSGYEFSAELPQPSFSTAAGQTDLFGFIYNANKRTWLLAAFVNGFS